TSFHPLESRLSNWRAQQDALKLNLLRRQFGLAEPVKRAMERQIVGAGEWAPRCLGGGGGAHLHEEILAGRDAEVGWEDVFVGDEGRDEVDFHGEMERRFGVGW
ncbi:20S proteasome maturation protein Ump1, partial [Teratosphaeria destructans]